MPLRLLITIQVKQLYIHCNYVLLLGLYTQHLLSIFFEGMALVIEFLSKKDKAALVICLKINAVLFVVHH